MLLKLKERKGETFSDFIARFTNKIQGVQEAHLSLVTQALMIEIKLFCSFLVTSGETTNDNIRGTLMSQSIHY